MQDRMSHSLLLLVESPPNPTVNQYPQSASDCQEISEPTIRGGFHPHLSYTHWLSWIYYKIKYQIPGKDKQGVQQNMANLIGFKALESQLWFSPLHLWVTQTLLKRKDNDWNWRMGMCNQVKWWCMRIITFMAITELDDESKAELKDKNIDLNSKLRYFK